MTRYFFFLVFLLGVVNCQQEAVDFLKEFNKQVPELDWKVNEAAWKRAINITDYNTVRESKASLEYSNAMKELRKNATNITKMAGFEKADKDTKRQFKMILTTMTSKNRDIVQNVSEIASEMEGIYSKGRIPYDKKYIKSIIPKKDVTELNLNDHLSEILAKSNDEEELRYVWEQWRKAVGPPLKPLYTQFVKLSNVGAKENGFQDAGDYKRKIYEVNDLDVIAEKFWDQLKPFYKELHAYVRYKMTSLYPDIVKDGEPLPAHVMGNMWAQSWVNLYKHVKPYPNEPSLDVTKVLLEKKYNATLMFKKAEEFFQSIGWQALPGNFWKKSMIVRPEDPKREVVCHASAWDFAIIKDGDKDVRVKMCTKVNEIDFNTVHHELGHIYYDLLYWNQSSVYRTGANPGFHEAVGDTLVLSVQTPTHLKKIGLLNSVSNSTNANINFLLGVALKKIAFLPFGYLMDQWMWKVYSGKIKPEDYNKAWWEMKLKYQGIKPPSERGEKFFDPGAKYHIPANTPYIRYFFSHILQFAFHKHACKKAGNTRPLHQCSIYQSKEAGNAFGDMLKLGKSKPWREALEQLTESREISAGPIHEYFAPLRTWLEQQRKEHKYKLGWEKGHSSSSILHTISFFTLLSFVLFALFF